MKDTELYFQLGGTWQILRLFNAVPRETFNRLINENVTELMHFLQECKTLHNWSDETIKNMSFILRQLWNLVNSHHSSEQFYTLLEAADSAIYDITMNGDL